MADPLVGSDSRVVPLRASDLAYGQLLEMILDLRMPPGSLVNEQQLALKVGLGRMPVREAISRLAGDRFITVMPRRGLVVTPLSLEAILDLFEAREAIECGIAYIVAHGQTHGDLNDLSQLIAAAEKARCQVDVETFLRDDHEIHSLLVEMVSNPFLKDTADRLLLHNLRFWRSYWSTRSAQNASMLSHAPLLAAIEAGDPVGAEHAMREHIAASRAVLRSGF